MSAEPSCPCRSTRAPLADRGAGLDEAPDLIPFLEPLPAERDALVSYYRCRVCGTWWQEQLEPFMHADVRVLLRSVLDETGRPRPLIMNLASTGLGFEVGPRRR